MQWTKTRKAHFLKKSYVLLTTLFVAFVRANRSEDPTRVGGGGRRVKKKGNLIVFLRNPHLDRDVSGKEMRRKSTERTLGPIKSRIFHFLFPMILKMTTVKCLLSLTCVISVFSLTRKTVEFIENLVSD